MTGYIGRFAPSPTGALHFGSLISAIASYCDAHAHTGQWLVRIEDTDIPRNVPQAQDQILTALDAFGLHWHSTVRQQSQHLDDYNDTIAQLAARALVYGCACSRKQLAPNAPYPATCRDRSLGLPDHAVRLRIGTETLSFNDQIQGLYCENLQDTTGDFILHRRDGIISYQLAVVVDDALQGVTHVVRGADLLDNTARQLWLGQCLGYAPLQYAHVPLVMNKQGQKLSKQNLAKPINTMHAPELLRQALRLLGQPDVDLDTPERMLAQAVAQWRLDLIPRTTAFDSVF